MEFDVSQETAPRIVYAPCPSKLTMRCQCQIRFRGCPSSLSLLFIYIIILLFFFLSFLILSIYFVLQGPLPVSV
jgi:hypothetical protein